jgi:hypothetical protein
MAKFISLSIFAMSEFTNRLLRGNDCQAHKCRLVIVPREKGYGYGFATRVHTFGLFVTAHSDLITLQTQAAFSILIITQ